MKAGWTDVALGDLAQVTAGGTPKRSSSANFGGTIPWVKIGDLAGSTITSTDETISDVGLRSSSAKLLPKGTLLLSIFASIGRTGVLGVQAATNQAIAGLLINDPERCSRGYLQHHLEYSAEGLAARGRGVAQANINLSILRSHVVPLPPIEEQRRISAVLDAADELRAKRRQAIAKLDTLTQAIFIDMFGLPTRSSVDGVPLGDTTTMFSGSTLPSGQPFTNQKTGKLLLKVSDLNLAGNADLVEASNEWTDSHTPKASTCPPETVVFAKRGGAIAKNRKRLTGREAVLDPNLMGVHAEGALRARYLFAWFSFLNLTDLQSGSSVPQLNKKDLVPLEIRIPPEDEQDRFSERTANVRVQRLAHAVSLVNLDKLCASFQHRAFRGEL